MAQPILLHPPWQHNFLAWTTAHIADQGYTEIAPFRDYMMKFTIGIFTHPDQISPFAGTSYYIFVGERLADRSVRWCRTWKEVSDLTYKAPGYRPRKVPTRVSYPGFGGSYSYIARAVLLEALRSNHPMKKEARKALDWLEGHLPNLRKVLAENPKWALSRPAPGDASDR